MKILYYCPVYHMHHHGGRSHARGFFHALGRLSSVSQCFLFPKEGTRDDAQNAPDKTSRSGKLGFLPPTVRRLVGYFRPRPTLTRALINEIKTNGCDALVIRTGVSQPTISRIKKACPNTSICLEINGTGIEESLPDLPLKSLIKKWEVMRYDQADAITVVSSYLKTYLEEYGIHPDKIIVNQNGVDVEAVDCAGLESVRRQYGIPKEAFVLGYIGGMESFRRLPAVVDYIADLRETGNDDIYFLIVGDGKDMPAVQAAIEGRRDVLENSVKCVGWQEYSEIRKFLGVFDLAVFPFTNAYCSPLKLFEYLGAGVPAIGPDTPTVKEIFQNNVHLKLVRQDGSDFTDAILELKNNPQFRRDMAQNGQRLVLKEYTWKKNTERVVAHIQGMRNG